MFRCIETFTTGEGEEFLADLTRVANDHPILATHRACFAPATSQARLSGRR